MVSVYYIELTRAYFVNLYPDLFKTKYISYTVLCVLYTKNVNKKGLLKHCSIASANIISTICFMLFQRLNL